MGTAFVGSLQRCRKQFLAKNYALGIYPAVLIVGLFIRFVLPGEVFKWIQNSYWISDQNPLNRVFANNGLKVFTVVYIAIVLTRVTLNELKNEYSVPLLPTVVSSDEGLLSKLMKYAKKYIILLGFYTFRYGFMYFTVSALFSLKNYGSTRTGGECQPNGSPNDSSDGDRLMNVFSCLPNEKWVPGSLNISGHYLFIVTLSLSLVYELKILLDSSIDSIEHTIQQEDDGLGFSQELKASIHLITGAALLTLTVVAIWLCVLMVTAIFYHTLIEKIIGLSLGYAVPVLNYLVFSKVYELA